MIWSEIAPQLTDPFAPADVSWRAGSVSRDKKRAQALAYAEPRVYEDRLNSVLGPDWSCRFTTWGDQRLICELTVRYQDDDLTWHEVTRTSSGEFDSGDRVAQGTAAEAQAFKRACSKFGLGRYLYDLPAAWVGYDENSRRLTETPNLPSWAVPKPATPKRAEAAYATGEPTLSRDRADAMHRAFIDQGFQRREHLKFASSLLDRTVTDFSELTDAEATLVWSRGKRRKKTA